MFAQLLPAGRAHGWPLLVFVLALLCAACNQRPETLVSGYDPVKMAAAEARARSEVDDFIAIMAKNEAEYFGVKVSILQGQRSEAFWLTDVTYRDGKFTGKIGNEPGSVTNVKFGDEINVAKNEISDWLFMRDGKMHGNYTLRPLMETMPEDEKSRYLEMLANP